MINSPFLRLIEKKDNFFNENSYPYNVDLFSSDNFNFEFSKPITILSGENGCGKSTLLEMIADHCGFNPVGGNADHLLHSEKHIGKLKDAFRFSWALRIRTGFFLRAESFGVFASYLDDMAKEEGAGIVYRPWGGKSLHHRSHGEAFMTLLSRRLYGRGIYILDEPEAALSPSRQFEFLKILEDVEAKGQSQIIIATHSPIILSYKNAEIFEIKKGKLIKTQFKETQNFKLYSEFINNPDQKPTTMHAPHPSKLKES
jgi:predicted ATPase